MILQYVSLPLLASLIGIGYIISLATYRIFFHPLRKYPGPLIHKITDAVLAYHQARGNLVSHVIEIHEKYGSVVRIAPRQLSYIEEQAWTDIYGHHNPLGTGNLPKDFKQIRPEEGNVISMMAANEVDHRRLRRIQAPMFSEKAISSQEPFIKGYCNLLISRLREKANSSSNVVDMMLWYTYTTSDILGELAFREPFGALKTGSLSTWIEMISRLLKDRANWSASKKFPWPLSQILYLMTSKNLRSVTEDGIALSNQKVHDRILRDSTQEKIDFTSQILKHSGEKGMTTAEIEVNARLLIFAGSETTATILSGVTYFLLMNREHLQKLTMLIRTTFPSEQDINALALYRLDYLSAVIDESFRLYPPLPGGLLRTTTKGGNVICGELVPEDVSVSVASLAANTSSKNWTDPEKFVPERWFKDERCPVQYRKDKKKVMQPFSFGPRNCIGKNMATAEIRLIIAHVLWNFDMELESDSLDWKKQKVYEIWDKKPLNVRLYPRKNL